MPDPDRKKVRIGQMISSDKIKQKEHETSGQRDAEHARGAASLELEANMKASIPLTYLILFQILDRPFSRDGAF